jgi:hypothetical protein
MTAPAAVAFARAAAIAAGISLVAAAPPPLARAAPESVGLDGAELGAANALLARYVDDYTIAGAVAAVARHGRLAWTAAAGLQDLESREPMRETSLFRI